jgi:hypothetical protein
MPDAAAIRNGAARRELPTGYSPNTRAKIVSTCLVW